MKIKFKLSIITIVIMVVVIVALAFIFLQQASDISLNLSRQSIGYLAEQQASFWKGREDAYIRVLQTVANVMEDYETVEPELRRNRYDTLPEVFARIDSLTAENIQEVANEVFAPERLFSLIYE